MNKPMRAGLTLGATAALAVIAVGPASACWGGSNGGHSSGYSKTSYSHSSGYGKGSTSHSSGYSQGSASHSYGSSHGKSSSTGHDYSKTAYHAGSYGKGYGASSSKSYSSGLSKSHGWSGSQKAGTHAASHVVATHHASVPAKSVSWVKPSTSVKPAVAAVKPAEVVKGGFVGFAGHGPCPFLTGDTSSATWTAAYTWPTSAVKGVAGAKSAHAAVPAVSSVPTAKTAGTAKAKPAKAVQVTHAGGGLWPAADTTGTGTTAAATTAEAGTPAADTVAATTTPAAKQGSATAQQPGSAVVAAPEAVQMAASPAVPTSVDAGEATLSRLFGSPLSLGLLLLGAVLGAAGVMIRQHRAGV